MQDFSIFVWMMGEGLPNAKEIGGKILFSFPDRGEISLLYLNDVSVMRSSERSCE